MQYKNSRKIIVDKRKLDLLIRLGCPISIISDYIVFNKITKTGDEIIDENIESLLEIKIFDNWGGARNNSGRKPKTNKNNQLENQDDNQLENQDDNQLENQDTFQVVDKDKDKDKDKDNMKERKRKVFIPPTLEEWLAFCKENTLDPDKMTNAFNGYAVANWHDSQGKKIKSWKQKILIVWNKPENKEVPFRI